MTWSCDHYEEIRDSYVFTPTWDEGYNGFGPLVAYKSHGCSRASSFTYSNLRMRFTNPDDEKNLLSPLMESDFYQQGNVKKYYLNLLGKSGNKYNSTDQMGQYHEFLYLMQQEGIGLITDADTPFEEYLGENGSQNLCEIPSLAGTADLNALITRKEPFQYYGYERIETKEMFDEYCQGIKSHSLYDTGLTAEYGDELITLCTCAYNGRDQRLLIVGRRLQ